MWALGLAIGSTFSGCKKATEVAQASANNVVTNVIESKAQGLTVAEAAAGRAERVNAKQQEQLKNVAQQTGE